MKPPERNDHDIIPQPLFDWPSNLFNKIKLVLSTPCTTPTPPEFSFQFTDDGAAYNLEVLRKYNLDLRKALRRNRTHHLATEKSSSPVQSSSKYLASILYGIEWKPFFWREANGHQQKSAKMSNNKI
jgi:hypothetical protein